MKCIKLITIAILLFGCGKIYAQNGAITGFCVKGATPATTSGLNSVNTLEGIVPGGPAGCLVSVFLTGTTTPATIYSNISGGILNNPFRATLSGQWLFFASLLNRYDVVMSGGLPPNAYTTPVTLTGLGSGGSGGGGSCGPVTGDNTSTNCGYGNLAGNSTSPPANTSTFGYQNLTYSAITNAVAEGSGSLSGTATSLLTGSDVVALGDEPLAPGGTPGTYNLVNVIGIGNNAGGNSTGTDMVFVGDSSGIDDTTGQDFVGVGDTSAENISAGSDNIVGVGNTSATQIGAGSSDILGLGDTSASVIGAGSSDIIGIGDASSIRMAAASSNVVGIGEGSMNQHGAITTPYTDAIGIGDAAGDLSSGNELIFVGTLAGACSQGSNDIALGNFSLGGGYGNTNCVPNGNTGNELISIGDHALAANTTGTDNTAIGDYAGSNGYVINVTNGYANLTGSDNTWIGSFAGPNTATQLSNTIALGYQAYNTASNQAVIGNSSTTDTELYGVTHINGAPGVAGGIQLLAGTDPGTRVDNVGIIAPTSVTAYNFILPGAADSGLMLYANSSNTVTQSFLEEVDGDCVVGVSGAWAAGSCGGGGVSGSGTTGYLPAWTGSTALGNSHLDDGVTTPGTVTSMEPFAVNATGGPSQFYATYDSHALTPGSSTTAVFGVNSSGQGMMSEAGGTAARVCNATNGVCGSGGGSVNVNGSPVSSPNFNGATPSPTAGTVAVAYAVSGSNVASSVPGTNPATCMASTGTNICLNLAPYYASPDGAITTTTTGAFGIGTSGSIGSCSTFAPNQGIDIVGAGTGGADYIGTVVTCAGTALTVTPSTATSVSGAVVKHDETHALQLFFTNVDAGATHAGTGWLNGLSTAGTTAIYRVNGPPQNTGTANAVIQLPSVPSATSADVIALKGFNEPSQVPSGMAPLIMTDETGTLNLFGAYEASGPYAPLSAVNFSIENLSFNSPFNSGVCLMNMNNAYSLQQWHTSYYSGSAGSTAIPSNTNSCGFREPLILNNLENQGDDINVGGFYVNAQITEHTHIAHMSSSYSVKGVLFDDGSQTVNPGFAGDSASIDYVWSGFSTCGISGGANKTVVNVQNLDSEQQPGATGDICDSGNEIYGYIAAQNPTTPNGLVIVGGINLTVFNLWKNEFVTPLHIVGTLNVDSVATSASTSPICPDGTNGAFTTVGCVAGTSYPGVTSVSNGTGGAHSIGVEVLPTGGQIPVYFLNDSGLEARMSLNGYFDGTAIRYTTGTGSSSNNSAGSELMGNGPSGAFEELDLAATGAAGAPWAAGSLAGTTARFSQYAVGGFQTWLNSQTGDPSFPHATDALVLNPAHNWYVDFSGNQQMASGTVLGWNGDTGLSRDAAGAVDVGNGTAGNKSGTINAATYGSGVLANGMTATTQTPGDNTLKVATDAFVIANSGGGGVSGSGTTGYIPAWTGSTALGNSHLDDGVTTAGAVTISEVLRITAAVAPGAQSIITTGSNTDSTQWQLCNTSSGGGCFNFGAGGTSNGDDFFIYDTHAGFLGSFGGGSSPYGAETSGGVWGWLPSSSVNASPDTGLSRDSAGVVDVGNGTAGDKSGSIHLANVTSTTYNTTTNCLSSASPAVCGSAAAGRVAIPAGSGDDTLVVNDSAVTLNSEIVLQQDLSLATALGVTCDTVDLALQPVVISRTPGTSFTVEMPNDLTQTDPSCVSYTIIN